MNLSFITFAICFLLFIGLCQEQNINLHSTGTIRILLEGNTAKLIWTYPAGKKFTYRLWYFISSDGNKAEPLAEIVNNGNITYKFRGLDIEIVKPTTLILKNVNMTYNGTYQFIAPKDPVPKFVFIAEEANATINCSSRVKMIVDGNFSCVCRSVGGNPPRNITWYHDDGQIGDTSYGENTLNLTKMTKQKSGIYTCVVQSYIFKNEKSTEVTVYNGGDGDDGNSNTAAIIIPTTVVGFGLLIIAGVTCYCKIRKKKREREKKKPNDYKIDSKENTDDNTKLLEPSESTSKAPSDPVEYKRYGSCDKSDDEQKTEAAKENTT